MPEIIRVIFLEYYLRLDFNLKNKIINKDEIITSKDIGSLSGLILALTLLMLPALGAPSEELLQDTFKSIILSLGVLAALFICLWNQKKSPKRLVLHPVLLFPVILLLYAAGSMAWAHTYLAGVEATRWFILSLLMAIIINTSEIKHIRRLITGIHIGITVASVWTALQFWFDFPYFPQGPNPASTFINRNFFAEYSLTALPLSIYLLINTKKPLSLNLLGITIGFNLIALMMSGTRSALIVLPFIILLIGTQMKMQWKFIELSKWNRQQLYILLGTIAITIGILGVIPTTNKSLIREFGVQTPLSRALNRSASITKASEYTTGSFSVREAMWRSTWDMVKAHPISGIGAGAWEVQAPLYQAGTTQVETDFYAHNEILQLVAEYGVVGWISIFIVGLFIYSSIKKSVNPDLITQTNLSFSLLRVYCLLSLLALLAVSNAGFPFRLAGTGALFAVCLGIVANANIRTTSAKKIKKISFNINNLTNNILLLTCGTCIVVATYVSTLAIECESDLVRAVKLALTITNSRDPNNPHWDKTKEEILTLLKTGISINPHYRKLTPMAADEMASWGDWRNAIWVWDSVLKSRPNVIAFSANIAKGYLQLGDIKNARLYLAKAALVQSNAPAVRAIEAQILVKEDRYLEAAVLIKQLFKEAFYDYDLVYTGYLVGNKARDPNLIVDSLELRLKNWPQEATDAWMKLGDVYSTTDLRSEEKALFCYQMALQSAPSVDKDFLLGKIPSAYQIKLRGEH